MLAVTGLIGALLLSAPAQAQSISSCAPYGTNYTTYPTDGATTHAFLCKNIATSVSPTSGRADILFGAISGIYQGHPFPSNVRALLKSHNVQYYFFNNRVEADSYFQNTAPFNQVLLPVHPFTGGGSIQGNARCANTGYGYSPLGAQVIAVAIYDDCTYDNFTSPPVTVVNPSLERTILHETGHAFDFTFGSFLNQKDIPSNRAGWNALRVSDGQALTTAWNTLSTTAKKNLFVCNLFSSTFYPSPLELDLNASKAGGPHGEVCGSGNLPTSAWVGIDPLTIASKKAPYFVSDNGSNQELC